MIRAFLPTLLLSLAMPAMAGDFSLDLPLNCDLVKTCHIQHLVDHDPSPQIQDHKCGQLTYDGHKGTDFALPSLAHMHQGVDVLAAADGIVRQVREGLPDTGLHGVVAGRECGNAVIIGHDERYETQYCHLEKGSVSVKTGQQIQAGTVLGKVGLSGSTEFPHLHFSVRKNGAVVDPFAPSADHECQIASEDTLWNTPPSLRPGGVITVALTASVPEFEMVRQGLPNDAQVDRKSPNFVLTAYGFGGLKGDELLLSLKGPKGVIAKQTFVLPRNHAQFFRAIGKKRGFWSWSRGTYSGFAELRRQGKLIDKKAISATLR